MGKIRVGIVGVGNCASSLVQGVFFYKNIKSNRIPGIMHTKFGKYGIDDIKFVAAFDIDCRKVGEDLSEAIFAPPNCTTIFKRNIRKLGVKVMKGPILDGVAAHMKESGEERTFVVDNRQKPVNVVKELKKAKVDVLVNYLPVGSEKATGFYANAAIKSGCAFVNCIPVFIASEKRWEARFKKAGLPIIGDDIKSLLGATITHRVLSKLFSDRGVKLVNSYQLNVGGNTDFLNMKKYSRLRTKKISKTEAVMSQLNEPIDYEHLHIGPSDYVPWLNDNKVCFIRMEGNSFGGTRIDIDLKLSVEDSPNSAGVVIDAIRAAKIAMDKDLAGAINAACAYFMKRPPKQFDDNTAKEMIEDFINVG